MKQLKISRKSETGSASYKTRGLDTIFERESQIQEDCIEAVAAITSRMDSRKEAEKIAKVLMSISAAVHSDIERILRNHGKPETAINES